MLEAPLRCLVFAFLSYCSAGGGGGGGGGGAAAAGAAAAAAAGVAIGCCPLPLLHHC